MSESSRKSSNDKRFEQEVIHFSNTGSNTTLAVCKFDIFIVQKVSVTSHRASCYSVDFSQALQMDDYLIKCLLKGIKLCKIVLKNINVLIHLLHV